MENSQARKTSEPLQGPNTSGPARYEALANALTDPRRWACGSVGEDVKRLEALAADCVRHGYPQLARVLDCALRGYADQHIAQIAVAVLIAEDLRS